MLATRSTRPPPALALLLAGVIVLALSSGREPDRKIKIDLSDALESPPPAAPPTAPLPISGLVPTNVTITDVPGLVLSYASGSWLLFATLLLITYLCVPVENGLASLAPAGQPKSS